MRNLEAFAALVLLDHGLVVVSSSRADGTIRPLVVRRRGAGRSGTGRPVVACAAAGASRRLTNLRAGLRATVEIRPAWRWADRAGGPTITSTRWTMTGFPCSSVPSSPLPAAPTTTGTSTTDGPTAKADLPESRVE